MKNPNDYEKPISLPTTQLACSNTVNGVEVFPTDLMREASKATRRITAALHRIQAHLAEAEYPKGFNGRDLETLQEVASELERAETKLNW